MYCPDCGLQHADSAKFCTGCGVELEGVAVGQVLEGRYRVDGLLGQGGMGRVYRARDMRLECVCAVKELRTGAQSPQERADSVARFKREAQILRGLSHAGLPRVYDFFEERGQHFLVQDFVQGESFEQTLARDGRPGLGQDRVCALALEALDILAYLHAQVPPVIHRDIKPANLMRRAGSGQVVLVDFGIARSHTAAPGTALGTAEYCSPEQHAGKAAPASDLYALGATMHHLLSGVPPTPFQFPTLDGVSTSLGEVLARATALNALDRYASAAEMRSALLGVVRSSQQGHPPALAEQPLFSSPHAVATTSHGTSEMINPTDGTVLLRIPGGIYTLGSDVAEENEKPLHSVSLWPYAIGKTAVTNAQYRRFVAATGHVTAGEWAAQAREWGEQAPVVCVSWHDAVAYCEWAGLRLPTEAEWEAAARGPDGCTYPWGNHWDGSKCRHRVGERLASAGSPVAVGSYPQGASPFGCLDMAGNVWEWCSSKYQPYPYDSTDDREASTGGDRVLRGGSWFNVRPEVFRGARRNGVSPSNSGRSWGFRVAKTL